MVKKIIIAISSILLGLTFLFSAYIKLFPIELFEFSFIEIKVANWHGNATASSFRRAHVSAGPVLAEVRHSPVTERGPAWVATGGARCILRMWRA